MENTGQKKLYVGNIKYDVEAEDLKAALEQDLGLVIHDCFICKDKHTGKSRGFGFITVSEKDEKVFLDASGSDFEGRKLFIKEANERKSQGEVRGGGRNREFSHGRR